MLLVATVYVVAAAPRPWALVVAIASYLALLLWAPVSETKE